jgi:hypothetical protein
VKTEPWTAVIKPELEPYRLKLRTWAAALLADQVTVPVLMQSVCHQLGISIRKSASVGQFQAYLSIDPSKEPSVSILLPRKRVGNFERFCIAHELAHYYLISQHSLSPKSKGEYWAHEVICDDFARHLLVPEIYIDNYLEEAKACTAEDYLGLCGVVTNQSRVPWTQAALRIAGKCSTITYCRMRFDGTGHLEVASTTLPGRKGAARRIDPQSSFYEIARNLLGRASPSGRESCDVSQAAAECPQIRSLFTGRLIAAFASASTGVVPDVRVAIQTGE